MTTGFSLFEAQSLDSIFMCISWFSGQMYEHFSFDDRLVALQNSIPSQIAIGSKYMHFERSSGMNIQCMLWNNQVLFKWQTNISTQYNDNITVITRYHARIHKRRSAPPPWDLLVEGSCVDVWLVGMVGEVFYDFFKNLFIVISSLASIIIEW